MAVAVKNAPVSAASSPFDRTAVVSLAGAAYVIVSLVIVFGALPYVWRTTTGLIGIGGDVLLGLLMVAVATGLAILGARLIGPKQPAGARAGIFVAIVLFLVVLLLTRWASLWLEYGVYTNHLFGPSGVTVGAALTGLILFALLVGEVYLFFRPEAEKYLIQLEGQGWFNATAYKGLQGQRVRRGTILGILLIAGSGVYTMMNNGFLRRLPESWALNVPFTGVATVESMGDAGPLLRELPQSDKGQVRIVAKGDSPFQDGAVLTQQAYRDAIKEAIGRSSDLSAATKDELIQELNKKDITQILDLPGASDALTAAVGPAALATLPPSGLPTAQLRLDQYALRNVNDQLNQKYVRVADAGLSQLTTDSVVTREEFDKAANDPSLKGVGGQPVAAPAFAAVGPLSYTPLTLLPALQYTLPLLLLALSLWGAWRVVNFPPFADFLIATEAELNKVSWTTRPRLIQDTIVVLVTVALLAAFLFLMDQTWRVVLSWKPIGVLQINADQSDKNKSAENLKW
jgi:preprotein translocase SecE subunit